MKHEQPRKKITPISIIGSIVIVVGITVATYFATANGVPLERYAGDGYSIEAPKGFTYDSSSGTSMVFKSTAEPTTKDVPPSALVITKQPYSDETPKSDTVAALNDKNATDFAKNYAEGLNGGTASSVTKKEYTHQGLVARQYFFDIIRDGKPLATRYQLYIFGEKEYYQIDILVHADDAKLKAAVERIFGSLKIE